MDERGRVLGIDPGERRIGLAVSDPLGFTAQGLRTFDRRRDGDFLAYLRGLVDRFSVERVVVGLPVTLSGREGEAAAGARVLAEMLRARLGLPVELWDERLTSVEAERTLAGTKAGKEAVDRVAAVLILQGYLDAHRRS